MPVDKSVKRLLQYRLCLMRFQELGFEKVFSYTLGKEAGVTAEQVRKDFSKYGIRGNKKGGYEINVLLVTINNIFNKNIEQEVLLVGMGNIGNALIQYKGFLKNNIRISVAFDIDPRKYKKKYNIPVCPLNKMSAYIRKDKIKIGIIAVPESVAQDVCNLLVLYGIVGIMNFSPLILKVPEGVTVNNISLSSELEGLIYHTNLAGISVPKV